jgi:hypothetical protein
MDIVGLISQADPFAVSDGDVPANSELLWIAIGAVVLAVLGILSFFTSLVLAYASIIIWVVRIVCFAGSIGPIIIVGFGMGQIPEDYVTLLLGLSVMSSIVLLQWALLAALVKRAREAEPTSKRRTRTRTAR